MATTKRTGTTTTPGTVSGGSAGVNCQVQGASIYYRIEDTNVTVWPGSTNGTLIASTLGDDLPTVYVPASKFMIFIPIVSTQTAVVVEKEGSA